MPAYDLIRGGPHAQSREPQKASQAHIAVASRTPLSRRRTNPRDLPRFLNMPDPEILEASFKLSDAQEMVARQQGFDSWQTLKTGLSTAPLKAKSSPSKATFVSAEPQLFVADIERSCEFFRDKLGFSLVFSYGKPPYYAQVGRDAARLNLRCVERAVIESANWSAAAARWFQLLDTRSSEATDLHRRKVQLFRKVSSALRTLPARARLLRLILRCCNIKVSAPRGVPRGQAHYG